MKRVFLIILLIIGLLPNTKSGLFIEPIHKVFAADPPEEETTAKCPTCNTELNDFGQCIYTFFCTVCEEYYCAFDSWHDHSNNGSTSSNNKVDPHIKYFCYDCRKFFETNVNIFRGDLLDECRHYRTPLCTKCIDFPCAHFPQIKIWVCKTCYPEPCGHEKEEVCSTCFKYPCEHFHSGGIITYCSVCGERKSNCKCCKVCKKYPCQCKFVFEISGSEATLKRLNVVGSDLEELSVPSSYELEGNVYTVVAISDSAFYNVKSVSGIILPTSIVRLGNSAFEGCDKLSSITMGAISQIGKRAFRNCTSLKSLTLTPALGKLEDETFSGCTSLEWITMKVGIKSLGNSVFSNCQSLTTIALPSTITTLGSRVFKNCSNLKQVTLPGSLKMVNTELFYGCSSLERITIPSNVSQIRSNAFAWCTNLEEVSLPISLLELGDQVFYNCYSLSSLTIPSKVKVLEEYVFEGCLNLNHITCSAKFVPSCSENTFRGFNAKECRLQVPAKFDSFYRNDPYWGVFKFGPQPAKL